MDKSISSSNSNFYDLPTIYESWLIKEVIEKQNTEIITVTEVSDLKLGSM